MLSSCVFSTKFLDPINWPKQIALVSLIPFLVFEVLDLLSYRIKQFKFMIGGLLGSILLFLIAALATNSNITRTLWGSWGRNNGLITQTSLFLCAFCFFLLAGFPKFKGIFIKSISLGMFPASVYGLIQFFELDWIRWSSNKQVFSFFGNTNFAASIFGLVAISSLCALVIDGIRSNLAPAYFAQAVISSFISWQTKSIQGLVLIAFALSLFVFAKAVSILRVNRVLALSSLTGGTILSILGFLGIGPLGSLLFQYTFELRSYYWKIGLLMGIDRPIFGVGIDSYGDNYRQFRSLDVAQVTSVDLTVNNAHNSLIQIFATTGIVGLTAVLCWVLPALIASLKVLTDKSKANQDLMFPILFLGSFAISMISIDNIAVATLHWAITGIMLRSFMAIDESGEVVGKKNTRAQASNFSFLKPVLLPSLVGLTFAFSWFASSGDRDLYQTFTTPADTKESGSVENRVSSLKEISEEYFLQESHFGYLSDGLMAADVWPIAYEVTRAGVAKYPLDFNLLDRASVLAERLGELSEAESFRNRQLQIDPRHPRVWLYLGKDLMEQGKLLEAKAAVSKTYALESLFDSSTREYRRQLEDVISNKSKE